MARRRGKKANSAVLTVGVIIVGLILAYPGVALAIFVVAVAGGVLYLLNSRRQAEDRRQKMRGYSLEDLDQLSGPEFEEWVTETLRAESIPAENIRDRGDYGVDVVADIAGTRIGLQVKRYSSSVGNSAVQEALAGSGYHDCALAGVVTQSTYTRAAKEQAERARVPVLLVDRENIHDLARLVREFASR